MLRNKIITIDNNSENARSRASIKHRLLPLVFFLSCVWVSLFDTVTLTNTDFLLGAKGDYFTSLLMEVIIAGAFIWLVFELLLFIYRFSLGFSIYTFIVPSFAIKDNIKWCIVLRNLISGCLYFLCFFSPEIYPLISIIDVVVLFLAFVVFAFFNMKRYVDPVVAPFAFKGLVLPFIIYEFIDVGLSALGWL